MTETILNLNFSSIVKFFIYLSTIQVYNIFSITINLS